MLLHNEIKITNISQAVQGDLIYHLFSIIGSIRSFIIQQSASVSTISQSPVTWEVLLAYSSEDEVWAATRLSGIELADRKLLVVPVTYEENATDSIINRTMLTSRTLYLANLPSETTELDLSQLFLKESLGKIIFARVFSGWPMAKHATEALGIPKYAIIELESARATRNVFSLFNDDAHEDSPVCWFSKDTHFNNMDGQDDDNSLPSKLQPHIVKVARKTISATNPLYAGLPEEALKRKMLQLAVSKSYTHSDVHRPTSSRDHSSYPERPIRAVPRNVSPSRQSGHSRTSHSRQKRSRSPEEPFTRGRPQEDSSYHHREQKMDKFRGERPHGERNRYFDEPNRAFREAKTRDVKPFDENNRQDREESYRSRSSTEKDAHRFDLHGSAAIGDDLKYRSLRGKDHERTPLHAKSIHQSIGIPAFRHTSGKRIARPLRSLSPPILAKREE